jgi:tyrosyl-tRNA synthetase
MQGIMPYATIQPPFTLKLREMPKKELHRYYHWFTEVLPQRIEELAAAVRKTPGFESCSLTARLPRWTHLGSGSPNRSKPEAERKGSFRQSKTVLFFRWTFPLKS